jgi:alpha/beta superfamily hydrolase
VSAIDTSKLPPGTSNPGTLSTEKLTLRGPAGALEALLESPASMGGVVTVCHPHPLYGGDMSNKVVHTLSRAFNECGIAALRFNYRGVGSSAGTYDDAVGETLDALAVLDYAAGRWPGLPLYLAGFSFGGAVSVRAARQRRIERLVTVAPAIERVGVEPMLPECPWLLIQGTADELLDPATTARWVTALARPPRLVMMEGVSHFFHGQLTRLKDVVVQWLQS